MSFRVRDTERGRKLDRCCFTCQIEAMGSAELHRCRKAPAPSRPVLQALQSAYLGHSPVPCQAHYQGLGLEAEQLGHEPALKQENGMQNSMQLNEQCHNTDPQLYIILNETVFFYYFTFYIFATARPHLFQCLWSICKYCIFSLFSYVHLWMFLKIK